MPHPNRNKVRDWPEALRGFRRAHDLTQKQLADKLQCGARTLQHWEDGDRVPPSYLRLALERIAQGLS